MDIEGISKAVSLSLIKKNAEEQNKLLGEIESILDNVADVQSISNTDNAKIEKEINVFREDIANISAGEYTEKILSQAPARFKDWFLSKKIL